MEHVDVEYYLPNSWDANKTEQWLMNMESASTNRERSSGRNEVFSIAETSIVFPLRFSLTIRARFYEH